MSISLIGMAGVGKTTIGKELSNLIGFKHIDSDIGVGQLCGLSPQEIIDKYDDDKFLSYIHEYMTSIDFERDCIISTGGEIVHTPQTLTYLSEHTDIIYLEDSLERIKTRMSNPESRGIVGLKEQTLEELFDYRIERYKYFAGITYHMPENPIARNIAKDILQIYYNIIQ